MTNRRMPVTAAALAAAFGVTLLAQTPVFHGGADAVLVDVEVLQGGRAVSGLTAADFELRDNNVAQTLDASLSTNVPLDLTMVIDTSGSVEGKRLDRLKTGVRDTAQWLRAEDRWRCHCGHSWNTFDTGGVCPGCRYQWKITKCLRCKEWSAHSDWYAEK